MAEPTIQEIRFAEDLSRTQTKRVSIARIAAALADAREEGERRGERREAERHIRETMVLGDESERAALALALGLPLPEEIAARERAAREEGERIGAARERRACYLIAAEVAKPPHYRTTAGIPDGAGADWVAGAIAARGPMGEP